MSRSMYSGSVEPRPHSRSPRLCVGQGFVGGEQAPLLGARPKYGATEHAPDVTRVTAGPALSPVGSPARAQFDGILGQSYRPCPRS